MLTFNKSEELRAVAAGVPLERLLVETDAPYLAPMPMRGKRNEPAFVRHTASVLAKVKGVSEAEIARGHDRKLLSPVRQGEWPRRHARPFGRMTLRFTILGCGSSPGVPRIDGNWGVCDPANPRNRRRRCAMLVERFAGEKRTAVLVDTGPDLREQILEVGLEWLDGVLYTHDHADHTHGIDDLRILAYRGRRRIDLYFDGVTSAILQRRFDYCFVTPQGAPIRRS